MTAFYWMATRCRAPTLPPPELALTEPDGLLAAGGDLAPQTLLTAYRAGIFPWYGPGQPILWWSPDPRTVLRPDQIHVSRSLRRRMARGEYVLTCDTAFTAVMRACAAPRSDGGGTWISEEMISAYVALHELGYAHSVEARYEGALVGGLYGVAIGGMFFGESMFSRRSDASKVALVHLCARLHAQGFLLIDCQVYSPHLQSLGAQQVSRAAFLALLESAADKPIPPGPWCSGMHHPQ